MGMIIRDFLPGFVNCFQFFGSIFLSASQPDRNWDPILLRLPPPFLRSSFRLYDDQETRIKVLSKSLEESRDLSRGRDLDVEFRPNPPPCPNRRRFGEGKRHQRFSTCERLFHVKRDQPRVWGDMVRPAGPHGRLGEGPVGGRASKQDLLKQVWSSKAVRGAKQVQERFYV